MTEPFKPYWLIHEPGKTSGFAIVDGDKADCEEDALAVWRHEDATRIKAFRLDMFGDVEATLIAEPFDA
jgi:hypothetical protein